MYPDSFTPEFGFLENGSRPGDRYWRIPSREYKRGLVSGES